VRQHTSAYVRIRSHGEKEKVRSTKSEIVNAGRKEKKMEDQEGNCWPTLWHFSTTPWGSLEPSDSSRKIS